MKIIFLNTWDATRSHELRVFIESNKADTDIFCLQEVGPVMQEMVNTLFSDWEHVFASKKMIKPTTGEVHEFFQATYVRKGLELVSSDVLMPEGTDIGLALYTHIRLDNTSFHVINVHGLPWPGKLDTPERIKFSETLLQYFETKEGVKIIGGDFNLLPEAKSIQMFEDYGYTDLIKKFTILTTRNRFAWEKYPGNELYFSDYVFVKDAQARTFTVPEIEISDHLPMIVEIEA